MVAELAVRASWNPCIRYLTTGRCNRGGRCMLTHVHFTKLNNDVKSAVKDRLREIYNSN